MIDYLLQLAKSILSSPIWHFTDESWLMTIVYCGLAFLSTYVAFNYMYGALGRMFFCILSPLFMDIYFAHTPDPFWFCDFDKFFIFAFVGAAIAFITIFVMFSLSIGFVKNIRFLFSQPIAAILAVIVGILWFGAACNGIGAFITHHPYIGFLMVMGMIPSYKTPTIYVEGKGHITGHGYAGGSWFHGDDGNDYHYDGKNWN